MRVKQPKNMTNLELENALGEILDEVMIREPWWEQNAKTFNEVPYKASAIILFIAGILVLTTVGINSL